MPGIFSDEARCSLFIKSGGKTGAFCFGRGRFRQTARQFFGLPITCRLCPREIIMQAAVPADKVAPNRLFNRGASGTLADNLKTAALCAVSRQYCQSALKCRALNYRAAVGAGTHNLVLKISKQLNRRGRFALGKLLFYCTAAATDARRAVRGMFI